MAQVSNRFGAIQSIPNGQLPGVIHRAPFQERVEAGSLRGALRCADVYRLTCSVPPEHKHVVSSNYGKREAFCGRNRLDKVLAAHHEELHCLTLFGVQGVNDGLCILVLTGRLILAEASLFQLVYHSVGDTLARVAVLCRLTLIVQVYPLGNGLPHGACGAIFDAESLLKAVCACHCREDAHGISPLPVGVVDNDTPLESHSCLKSVNV